MDAMGIDPQFQHDIYVAHILGAPNIFVSLLQLLHQFFPLSETNLGPRDVFFGSGNTKTKKYTDTPWKINMDHKHGGLEDHVPF